MAARFRFVKYYNFPRYIPEARVFPIWMFQHVSRVRKSISLKSNLMGFTCNVNLQISPDQQVLCKDDLEPIVASVFMVA